MIAESGYGREDVLPEDSFRWFQQLPDYLA